MSFIFAFILRQLKLSYLELLLKLLRVLNAKDFGIALPEIIEKFYFFAFSL